MIMTVARETAVFGGTKGRGMFFIMTCILFALMLSQVNQPDLISSWRQYLSLSLSFFL